MGLWKGRIDRTQIVGKVPAAYVRHDNIGYQPVNLVGVFLTRQASIQEKTAFLPDYNFKKQAEPKKDWQRAEAGGKKDEGSNLGTPVRPELSARC